MKAWSNPSYGAFVDIGGVDGMVHVSELSWKRISKPADVVAVGDKVDVYVINFDKETHKISLGYKDPAENPWTKFMAQYKVGDIASVTVVKLMTFGAFAQSFGAPDFDVYRGKTGSVLARSLSMLACFSRRPFIDPARCVRCGVCVDHCPVPGKALSFRKGKDRPPVYNRKKCIRCFCCQEMCPQKAITAGRRRTGKGGKRA